MIGLVNTAIAAFNAQVAAVIAAVAAVSAIFAAVEAPQIITSFPFSAIRAAVFTTKSLAYIKVS